jgi:hypothetical protein
MHGIVGMPDGSVVFNFDYAGLARLDRCGKVVWALQHRTHHSVERAEGGGFWVPGRRPGRTTSFAPFEPPFFEDLILKISEDGRILKELSVPKIFYDNGLDPILTVGRNTVGQESEIVHLNKITELTSEMAPGFPMFEAGDLMLSFRDLNLIMVVDQDAVKVKWWQIGPWKRQHDPEFTRDGLITLFNNNAYETLFGPNYGVSPLSAERVSNIAVINPATREYRVVYGGNKDQELFSIIRGRVDVTPQGGLFITEFEGGRVLETDARGTVVWEYVNRYDSDEVAEISEARLYPSGYFHVSNWSCQ